MVKGYGHSKMNWQDLIKYPNLLDNMNPDLIELMDTMQELVPIEEQRDRVGTMTSWLYACLVKGIITPNEDMKIKHEMIHGCGGF